MSSIERKSIKGKLFFYLIEQVCLKMRYKKIQVYLGKSIPKNLTPFYKKLAEKEIELVAKNIKDFFAPDKFFNKEEIKKLEAMRIDWKYKQLAMTDFQSDQFWRRFSIQFIFESNAIEGSRLSQREVAAIIKKQRIKKSLVRQEIQEVINSIKAFELMRSEKFKLNQRAIINLHALLMKGTGMSAGYKKHDVIVHNKLTTPPGKVRKAMSELIGWFELVRRSNTYPLEVFANFHQRFEKIHPFEDGNGRIGRLLFNWMLFAASYPPILFRKINREAYFSALDKADEGRKGKWYRHVIKVFKRSVAEILDI